MLLAFFVPAQATSAEDTIRIANNAFEYRDFEKVIQLLEPFVTTQPLPIEDPRMITAYELLGVSRHVTGDVAGARREFAQLLLGDPEHQLDAFKIPPQVIETFEALRREMKERLDRILAERGRKPKLIEPPPGTRIPIDVPERYEMWIPGGVPQFVLDQDLTGLIFLATQVVGVAANVIGYLVARGAELDANEEPKTDADRRTLEIGRIVWGSGLLTFGASYGVSVFLGNSDFAEYRENRLKAPPSPGITFQLPF